MTFYRPMKYGEKMILDKGIPSRMLEGIKSNAVSSDISETTMWVSGEVYNVKAYGAQGNGVADDTQAVTDAISAMQSDGGGTLFFPPGTYNVSSTLQIDIDPNGCKFVEICGAGANSVINYTAEDGTDCLYILGTATTGIKMLNIHNIQLTGAGKTATTGNGLHLRRCIMPKSIKQVAINRFGGGAGIKIQSSWVNNIYSCYIQECGYGVEITNDSVTGSWGSRAGRREGG